MAGLFAPAASFWGTALERRWNGAFPEENRPLVEALDLGNEHLKRLVLAETQNQRDALSLVANLCLLDRHEVSLEQGWAWDPKTFA